MMALRSLSTCWSATRNVGVIRLIYGQTISAYRYNNHAYIRASTLKIWYTRVLIVHTKEPLQVDIALEGVLFCGVVMACFAYEDSDWTYITSHMSKSFTTNSFNGIFHGQISSSASLPGGLWDYYQVEKLLILSLVFDDVIRSAASLTTIAQQGIHAPG
ncbi:uncharacterized protein BDW70DRAFT_100218 [Aspergillus foveolatus]|uniref:uncharacterized protein n=1 Tax=Aspergillus foveolatus TaxID=210207 RepID=UPI003CCD0AB8